MTGKIAGTLATSHVAAVSFGGGAAIGQTAAEGTAVGAGAEALGGGDRAGNRAGGARVADVGGVCSSQLSNSTGLQTQTQPFDGAVSDRNELDSLQAFEGASHEARHEKTDVSHESGFPWQEPCQTLAILGCGAVCLLLVMGVEL